MADGYGRGYRPLCMTDDMPLGKHKGEQIEDLIYDHPSYVVWLYEESTVKFDKKVIEFLKLKRLI